MDDMLIGQFDIGLGYIAHGSSDTIPIALPHALVERTSAHFLDTFDSFGGLFLDEGLFRGHRNRSVMPRCFLLTFFGSFLPLDARFHSSTFTPWRSSLPRLALKYLSCACDL